MPYASDAQRRKFHTPAMRRRLGADTIAEWDKASKGRDLPEQTKRKKNEALRKVGRR